MFEQAGSRRACRRLGAQTQSETLRWVPGCSPRGRGKHHAKSWAARAAQGVHTTRPQEMPMRGVRQCPQRPPRDDLVPGAADAKQQWHPHPTRPDFGAWAAWNSRSTVLPGGAEINTARSPEGGGKSTRRFQERGKNQDGGIVSVRVSARSSGTIAVSISAWQNCVPQIPNGGRLGPAVWVAWLAWPALLCRLGSFLLCRLVLASWLTARRYRPPAPPPSFGGAGARYIRTRPEIPRPGEALAPEMRALAEPGTLNPGAPEAR
jgi:hypothetical protein